MKRLILVIGLVCACGPAAALATPTPGTPVPTITTQSPTASPAPTASPIAKLKIGEAVDLGGVRITVQTAEESAVPPYYPTAKPGMGFVSVVLRYDNGISGPIQLFYEPWQMVGTDGVRRTTALPLRNDKLVAGSVVPSGGFLVGSLTFEAPSGPLDLYYTNPTTSRQVIWTIR
jgi:hypothetical protein